MSISRVSNLRCTVDTLCSVWMPWWCVCYSPAQSWFHFSPAPKTGHTLHGSMDWHSGFNIFSFQGSFPPPCTWTPPRAHGPHRARGPHRAPELPHRAHGWILWLNCFENVPAKWKTMRLGEYLAVDQKCMNKTYGQQQSSKYSEIFIIIVITISLENVNCKRHWQRLVEASTTRGGQLFKCRPAEMETHILMNSYTKFKLIWNSYTKLQGVFLTPKNSKYRKVNLG